MTGHLGIPRFNDGTADLLEDKEAWVGLIRGGRLCTLAIEDNGGYASIHDLSVADLQKLGEDLIALAKEIGP